MSDLVLSIRLTADGKDLVGAVQQSEAAIGKMGDATKRAASEAEKLNAQQKGLSEELNTITQAQVNANYQSWKAAEAWSAQRQAVTGASAEIQKILNVYDPLGTKLRQLTSDWIALDKAIAAGATGGTPDAALDSAMRSLKRQMQDTQKLMDTAGGEVWQKTMHGLKQLTPVAVEAGTSITSLGLNTQYARRELMMLGREVMTGDFSQMPRTFGSLLAHSNLISIALHPVTLGFIALGATAAAVAMLAVHTEQTARAMNGLQTQFTATGREGLFPTSQLKGFVDELARMPGQTRESATATISALAAVPNMSGPLFERLVSMVGDFAAATGRKAPDAMKELAKAFTDPVGQAAKLHNELGILTGAQILNIESLFNQGEALEATKLLLDAVTERTKNLAREGLTPLQKATNDLGNEWDSLKQKMAGTPDSGLLGYFTNLTNKLTAFVSAMNSGDTANAILKFAQLGGGGGLTKGMVNLIPDFPSSAPGARSAAGSIGGLVQQRTAEDIQHEIDAAVLAAARYAGQSKTLSDLQNALIKNDEALRNAAAGTKEELVLAQAHLDIEKKIADTKYSMGAEGRKAAGEAKKLQDQILKGYVDMAEAIVKADFEATAEIAKQEIQAAKEEEKRQQDNVKGYVAMAEAIVQANFSEAQQIARDQIAAANTIAQAERRMLNEREREQKRSAREVERLIGDGAMRGFERGVGFAENFRDTLVNMFKTLVLRPIINFIVSPVAGAISAALGGMGLSGTANAANEASGVGSALGAASMFSNLPSIGSAIGNFGTAISTFSTMLAEGSSAAGAFSAAAAGMGPSLMAVAPYVGIALAAGGALGLFGGKERTASPQFSGLFSDNTITRTGLQSGPYGQTYTAMGSSPSDIWGGSVPGTLPADQLAAFNIAIASVFDQMSTAAKSVGMDTSALEGLTVRMGVTGQGVQADMTAALNNTADTIAAALIPNITGLQQSGETLAQTFARVTGAQAQATAAAQAQADALAKVRQSWQDQVDVLTGARTQLQVDRTNQLASTTDAATQALMNQTFALQDQKTAAEAAAQAAKDQAAAEAQLAQTRQSWQDQVDVLLGAKTQNQIERAAQLASTTDAATHALMNQTFALQDQKTAAEAAAQAADAVTQAQKAQAASAQQLRQTIASNESSLASSVQGLVGKLHIDTLQAAANSLATSDFLSPTDRFAAAQNQLAATYAQARGGDLGAVQNFPAMLQSTLSLARDVYASGPQFQQIFVEGNRELNDLLTKQKDEQSTILKDIPVTIQQSGADTVATLKIGFAKMTDELAALRAELRRLAA